MRGIESGGVVWWVAACLRHLLKGGGCFYLLFLDCQRRLGVSPDPHSFIGSCGGR